MHEGAGLAAGVRSGRENVKQAYIQAGLGGSR